MLHKSVKSVKTLGLHLQENLSWTKHTDHISKKVGPALGLLKRVRDLVDFDTLVIIYKALIQPHLDYGCVVWDGMDKGLAIKLQKLQNRAARIITRSCYDVRSCDILADLGWETLEKRRYRLKKSMMTKIMNRKAPKYLEDLFRPKQSKSSLVLRDAANKLEIPMPKTDCFKQSISYSGAALCNKLSTNERKATTFFSPSS